MGCKEKFLIADRFSLLLWRVGFVSAQWPVDKLVKIGWVFLQSLSFCHSAVFYFMQSKYSRHAGNVNAAKNIFFLFFPFLLTHQLCFCQKMSNCSTVRTLFLFLLAKPYQKQHNNLFNKSCFTGYSCPIFCFIFCLITTTQFMWLTNPVQLQLVNSLSFWRRFL